MKFCPVCKKRVYIGTECDVCHTELVVIPEETNSNVQLPNPKSKLYKAGCVLFFLYSFLSCIISIVNIKGYNDDISSSLVSLVLPRVSYSKLVPLIVFLVVLCVLSVISNRIVLLVSDKKRNMRNFIENSIPVICSLTALIQSIYLIIAVGNMAKRYESVLEYGVSGRLVNVYNKIMCWTAFGEGTLMAGIFNIAALIVFIVNLVLVCVKIKDENSQSLEQQILESN